jgi:hypothetical protein
LDAWYDPKTLEVSARRGACKRKGTHSIAMGKHHHPHTQTRPEERKKEAEQRKKGDRAKEKREIGAKRGGMTCLVTPMLGRRKKEKKKKGELVCHCLSPLFLYFALYSTHFSPFVLSGKKD